MTTSTITIKASPKQSRKFIVEIDLNKLEKLAATLGLFNPDFLKSLDQAERECRAGKIKKIKSLKDLMK